MKLKITKQHLFKFLKRSCIVLLGLFVLFLLLNLVFPLPDKIEYSTIITDNKGELINAYLTHDEKWRMKTELDEISPLLRKTIIAKEDKYLLSAFRWVCHTLKVWHTFIKQFNERWSFSRRSYTTFTTGAITGNQFFLSRTTIFTF